MQCWKIPKQVAVAVLPRLQALGPERRREILHPKREKALAEWARRKMGTARRGLSRSGDERLSDRLDVLP